MESKLSHIKKIVRSLSFRLPFLVVSSCIAIMLTLIIIVYIRFQGRMIEEYARMAKGVTNLMAQEIDASKVDDYMEKNVKLEEYNQIVKRFESLKENYPDVLYLYVFRIQKDGAHVVIDLDTEKQKGVAPGSIYELSKTYLPYLDDLSVGKEVPIQSDHTKDGYLLTYMRPIFDDAGNYQCHACVDFSMDYLYKQDMYFILTLLGLLSVVVLCILLFDIHTIHKTVTMPINQMVKCTGTFSYATEEDRFHNVQLMEELNIQTGDEIEELFYQFTSVLKESVFYMARLSKAKDDIRDKEEQIDQISQTAYRDSLTNVGNKAAYIEEVDRMTTELQSHPMEFAIVMIDVNNLKYVNDTFGHEAGDSYIQGCCKIICNLYKKSPVFRIGGDEFVVILKGEDYQNRQNYQARLIHTFMKSYTRQDKKDWERYSASVGMSEYTSGDTSVEQVFKRADKAMYEYKLDFKKKFGSYR